MLRWLPLLAACACGRLFVRTEEPMDVLTSAAQIQALHGQSVRAEGTVVRPTLSLGPGPGWNGTALELSDGTVVWVSYARDLPPGWEGTEGRRVVMTCKVWRRAPPDAKSAVTGPHLSECSVPVVLGG